MNPIEREEWLRELLADREARRRHAPQGTRTERIAAWLRDHHDADPIDAERWITIEDVEHEYRARIDARVEAEMQAERERRRPAPVHEDEHGVCYIVRGGVAIEVPRPGRDRYDEAELDRMDTWTTGGAW